MTDTTENLFARLRADLASAKRLNGVGDPRAIVRADDLRAVLAERDEMIAMASEWLDTLWATWIADGGKGEFRCDECLSRAITLTQIGHGPNCVVGRTLALLARLEASVDG